MLMSAAEAIIKAVVSNNGWFTLFNVVRSSRLSNENSNMPSCTVGLSWLIYFLINFWSTEAVSAGCHCRLTRDSFVLLWNELVVSSMWDPVTMTTVSYGCCGCSQLMTGWQKCCWCAACRCGDRSNVHVDANDSYRCWCCKTCDANMSVQTTPQQLHWLRL